MHPPFLALVLVSASISSSRNGVKGCGSGGGGDGCRADSGRGYIYLLFNTILKSIATIRKYLIWLETLRPSVITQTYWYAVTHKVRRSIQRYVKHASQHVRPTKNAAF